MSQRLSLVEDFINTRSIELDTDEIATRDELAAWLRARGLIDAGDLVTAAGLRRTLRVREGLRALTVANSDPPAADAARDVVAVAARDAVAVADLAALAR